MADFRWRLNPLPIAHFTSPIHHWNLMILIETTICNKAYFEKSGKLPIFNFPTHMSYPSNNVKFILYFRKGMRCTMDKTSGKRNRKHRKIRRKSINLKCK